MVKKSILVFTLVVMNFLFIAGCLTSKSTEKTEEMSDEAALLEEEKPAQ